MRSSGIDREVDLETGRIAHLVRNMVMGNIFYGCGDRAADIPAGNVSDFNLYVNPPGEKAIDLNTVRKSKGLEMNSTTFEAEMKFSLEDGILHISPLLPEYLSPRIFEMTEDYFGTPQPAKRNTQVGPFLQENMKLFLPLKEEDGSLEYLQR